MPLGVYDRSSPKSGHNQARPRLCAVYAILNLISGESYIGSSKDALRRMKEHYNRMKRGAHRLPKIAAAVSEYGIDAFTFIIVEECNLEDRFLKETYWLKLWLPEYNSCYEDARNHLGYKHSNNTKMKMSAVTRRRDNKGKFV